MGLVLDSGVLIAAEREAKPVSDMLSELELKHGETEVVISSITVIELEHGLHRANTTALARQRRAYLDTVFLAIPVEPFTKEMGQLAAKIDADAKRTGLVIPFEDLAGKCRRHRCFESGGGDGTGTEGCRTNLREMRRSRDPGEERTR